MKIINCLRHPAVFFVDGRKVVLPPSGRVVRIRTRQKVVGYAFIKGVEIPIVQNEVIEVVGLPSVCENCRRDCKHQDGRMHCHMQQPRVMYLVPSFVSKMLHKRKDLLAPDTSPRSVVRRRGRVVGVRRLQRW